MVRKEYSKDEILHTAHIRHFHRVSKGNKILQNLYVCGVPIYETCNIYQLKISNLSTTLADQRN